MRALVLLLAVGAPAPGAAADDAPAARPARAELVLFPARVSNLDAATAEALQDAVLVALKAAAPEAEVAAPSAAADVLRVTGTPEAAARALGADTWITIGALKLDALTEVTLTRHRSGARPVAVRAPMPERDALPAAARGWVARLLAEPDPTPRDPRGADARTHDRTTWGVRVGGVWSVASSSGGLMGAEAEVHDRAGRWFVAGSLGGRMALADEGDGYYIGGLRLRSGLYGGQGPWWPSLWLGIEPRMIFADDTVFSVMPVGGIGVELIELGGTRLSLDLEVGYNLMSPTDPESAESADRGRTPIESDRPIELGAFIGMAW